MQCFSNISTLFESAYIFNVRIFRIHHTIDSQVISEANFAQTILITDDICFHQFMHFNFVFCILFFYDAIFGTFTFNVNFLMKYYACMSFNTMLYHWGL